MDIPAHVMLDLTVTTALTTSMNVQATPAKTAEYVTTASMASTVIAQKATLICSAYRLSMNAKTTLV